MDVTVNSTKAPLVSVIMPVYNGSRFVEQAIRSVQNQTLRDWELFVLDDCSTDDTCERVERIAAADPRIRLVRSQSNRGVARARNQGFALSRGRYVALLDSDDLWHPTKLQLQLEQMQQTGAQLCYCSYAIVDEAGGKVKADYLVPQTVSFEELLRENVIGCSTVVLTAEVVGRYRFETDFFHEDYVLWLHLLKDGYTACGCTEVLAAWRYLENSRSFNKRKSAHNRWKIYRDYLRLPVGKSIGLFVSYAVASLRKYRG